MLRQVTRRLLIALPLAWAVVGIVFVLVQLVPGAPFHELAGAGRDPRSIDHLRGLVTDLDRPAWSRYLDWTRGALGGDLGASWRHRRPVAELLAERVGNTLLLAGLALAAQLALGLAAGLAAARRPRSATDRAVTAVATLIYSIPSYALGLALIALVSLRLGWLPPSQMHDVDAARWPALARAIDALRHAILPAAALALPAAAGVALYLREQLGRQLADRSLLAARARGLGRRGTLWRHALRPALVPVVQLVGLSLPALVGGSVVIEVLFAWPGMGRLAWEAVLARDEPLVLGCTLVGTLAVASGSLVADLASAALDPRTGGSG